MYNLIILLASFVFVLATGVLLKPIPAAAGEVPVAPLDRDVAFRVSIAALVISCLLVAGLIAAYSAHPETFRWAVARPLDRMLDRYYWVMFAGAGLYVIVRLCGAKSRWSLWVLCLSLPGALTFPVTCIAALAVGEGRVDGVILEFVLHPATWILPFIAVRQWIVLREPGDIRSLFGLALTLFIVAVYLIDTPLRLPRLG
jgi:hypothetical protein